MVLPFAGVRGGERAADKERDRAGMAAHGNGADWPAELVAFPGCLKILQNNCCAVYRFVVTSPQLHDAAPAGRFPEPSASPEPVLPVTFSESLNPPSHEIHLHPRLPPIRGKHPAEHARAHGGR